MLIVEMPVNQPQRAARSQNAMKKARLAGLFEFHPQCGQTTASSFSFFGLMNCSRETPSHITSGLETSTDE